MKKLTLPLLIGTALLALGAQAADQQRAISYFTSWGASDFTAEHLKQSKMDTLMLSFGRWDTAGNISTSDALLKNDYSRDYMEPTYIAWTQTKLANPNMKMLLAFGGETFEYMWSDLASAANRETIAQGLVKLLNTGFPVYKKNLKPEEMVGDCLAHDYSGSGACDMKSYQRAGTVYLDGIDFDYEKSARLTPEENDHLLKLAQRVKTLLGTNSNKILSLTTYHVGADPVSCLENKTSDCSFSGGSIHFGEVLNLLQQSKGVFDFYNVMAYDAGQNFKYDVAMRNYANAVGDASKIVLGQTINDQWGEGDIRWVESREKNVARAEWQAANNYGGFFVWTLGSNNQQLSVKDQVAYVAEMKDAADRGNGGAINQAPVAQASYPAVVIGASDHVELDGSASYDHEGSPLTYKWEQVSGPEVTLMNSDQAKAFFSLNSPMQDQTLRFRLTVNDGSRDSAPLEFNIQHKAEQVVPNQPPVAVVNAPKEAIVGRVDLNGEGSYDAEGATLSYHWEQTAGTPVTLMDANKAHAYFTLNKSNADEVLQFTLTVNDGELDSVPAAFSIKHKAQNDLAPTASITATPKELKEGRVTLNGSASSGPEGAKLTYKWEQIAGTPVQLNNADRVQASFDLGKTAEPEILQFRLTVNDGKQDSAPSVVIILHHATSGPGQNADWELGKAYKAGDKVQGRDGNTYECRADNGRNGWCGLASAYEPGVGWAWQEAWTIAK